MLHSVSSANECSASSIDNNNMNFAIHGTVPLLERPPETSGRRERKRVERYVQQNREESKRGAHVLEEGSGEKLGDCPVICHNIGVSCPPLSLLPCYTVCQSFREMMCLVLFQVAA